MFLMFACKVSAIHFSLVLFLCAGVMLNGAGMKLPLSFADEGHILLENDALVKQLQEKQVNGANNAFAMMHSRPDVEFLSPLDESVFQTSSVLLDLKLKNFRVGIDGFLCLMILWDKGKMFECFPDKFEARRISTLEHGKYVVTALLVQKSKNLLVGRRTTRFFMDYANVQPEPSLAITFPRENERVTVTTLDVTFIAKYFAKGYVCLALDREPNHLSDCVNATQISMTLSSKPGKHQLIAALAYVNGSFVNQHSTTQWVNFHVEVIQENHVIPLKSHGTLVQGISLFKTDDSILTTQQQTPRSVCLRPLSASSTSIPGEGECKLQMESSGLTRQLLIQREDLHIMIMSHRSVERYEEAMVMIKSLLLYHHGKRRIHFHILTDAPGTAFFGKHLVKANIPCLSISYYDFENTCAKYTDEFLLEFGFDLSYHYSGRAGYCRLFIPKIFRHLGLARIIAIESDQLFFRDIEDLWNEFQYFSTKAFIGMPEMYRHWHEGRLTPGKYNISIITADTLHDRYHGNGYIGGVIMYDLENQHAVHWESTWRTLLRQYTAMNPDWSPQLNDQDVFNAVFTVQQDLVYCLPCQWNLQYHAMMVQHLECPHSEMINCPQLLAKGVFLCPKSPGIVHFMAQSYQTFGDHASYYNDFWISTRKIAIDLFRNSHQGCMESKAHNLF